jgi:hypothetical protein
MTPLQIFPQKKEQDPIHCRNKKIKPQMWSHGPFAKPLLLLNFFSSTSFTTSLEEEEKQRGNRI